MALTEIPIELSSTPGIVDNSNATAITIDASENVGIGTSTPSSYNSAGDDLVIASAGAGLTIASATNDSGHILFADSTTGTGAYTGFIRYDHTTDSMRFAVNAGVERMRIDASGRLGLGITPSATTAFTVFQNKYLSLYGFDAAQSHIVTNTYYPVDNAVFKRQALGYAQKLTMNNGSYIFNTAASGAADSDITFTPVMTLDASGNLLVNRTGDSGFGKLQVYGNVDLAGGNVLLCRDTGLVGIGTTLPSQLLHLRSATPAIEFDDSGFATVRGRIYSNEGNLLFEADYNNARANSNIAFEVDGAERMRIDASGNVGIGTNTATSIPGFTRAVKLENSTSASYVVSGGLNEADFGISSNGGWIGTSTNVPMRFASDGTERMRIDASGNLLVGTTTATAKLAVDGGLSSGETIRADNSKANFAGVNVYSVLLGSGTNGSSCGHFQGYAEGAVRFLVQGNGAVYGNGTYGTYSDLKLKENIVDANSQWADIKAVQLKNYSMKEDGLSEANQLGVIAQDLEASGMQKLVEEIDDKDVDGNLLGTATKHVKYSVLHLKALGALQEAMERIESLEARIAALES